MNKNTTKKNGGRTEGSFSFAKIKMGDLCAKLKGDSEILVASQWAIMQGFKDLQTGPAAEMLKSVKPAKAIVPQAPKINTMAATTNPVAPASPETTSVEA